MSDASAKSRLLGAPPTLSSKVALQVALTSIRVRLSRSLVTVSSVVLAVAFLLNVLGENVGNHAVYTSWLASSAPARQAQQLRDSLQRPRTTIPLLTLLATQREELSTWHTQLGGTALASSLTDATTALELAQWIDSLSPSQSYLIRRNRTRDEWLISLDADQVTALEETAKQLKGVRLEITHDRLIALASAMPQITADVKALAASEDQRLEKVIAAGGTDALLQQLAQGDQVDPLLLPISQILPGFDAQQRQNLEQQLTRDRARLRAAEIVSRYNAGDPSLLAESDVHWDVIQATLSAPKVAPILARLAEANASSEAELLATVSDPNQHAAAMVMLNRILASEGLYRRDAFKAVDLDRETESLAKRVKLTDRQRTRLNRLLLNAAFPQAFVEVPPDRSLDLRSVIAATDDASIATLRTSVEEAVGELGLAALDEELARRHRLSDLERTFQGIAYDPAASAKKTFWLVVLSLLVCIVGIVNTMMMAVTERFREIATMKCLGAMDSFILKSFLIESGLVGAIGSALGAVIGLALVLLQISIRYGGSFWNVFPTSDLAIVAGGSLICGLILAIVGALLPALKAARMHPIEAMRIDA